MAQTSVFLLLFCVAILSVTGTQYPVILVPGDGGCQIQAKLHRDKVVHKWCDKTSNWYTLWLNAEMIIPEVVDCFVDNMKLLMTETSPSTVEWAYQSGVSIRLPDWGYTTAFETLDPSLPTIEPYFKDLVNSLLEQGYVENRTLRGVPYDWRLTPSNLTELHDHIQEMVEETFAANEETPIIFLSHSMGGLVLLSFLQSRPQTWRDKYVRAFIPVSGPWAGTMKIVRAVLSGSKEGIPIVSNLDIRPAQRTFASNGWLMPNPEVFNNITAVVKTTNRTYSIDDLDTLFADAGFPIMSAVWRSTNLTGIWASSAPQVPTFCLYSIDVPTEVSYVYGNGAFPDSQPTIIHGQGDGTVNYESLSRCHSWAAQQTAPLKVVEFSGPAHMDVIKNSMLIKTVIQIITSL